MRINLIFLYSLLINATTGLSQTVEHIPQNFSLEYQYFLVGNDSIHMTIYKDLNDTGHLGDTGISIYSQIANFSYLKSNFRIHDGDTLPGSIRGKTFDTDGNLVVEIDSTAEGKILSRTMNYYVNTLKIKSEQFYLSESHNYLYDTSYLNPQNYKTTYFYTDSLRPSLCTKEITLHWGYRAFSNRKASEADTTINYYSYDHHGNQIKDIHLYNGDTLSVEKIHYDSANREVKRISKSISFDTTIFIKTYDDKGNLISSIVNMPNGSHKELYYYNSKNELIRREIFNQY